MCPGFSVHHHKVTAKETVQALRAWWQAIKDALRRLVELMEEWQLILAEKSRGTFHEPVSSAAAKSV